MQHGLPGLCLAALALLTGSPGLAEPSWQKGHASFVETTLTAPEAPPSNHPAWPVAVRLDQPTDRYRHDIMGGVPPWRRMQVTALPCAVCEGGTRVHTVVLASDMVFEDPAPRLWDVSGDGVPEIIVVETSLQQGARLAVWTMDPERGLERMAATPFIGRPQRWLAPVAAGDLDGDGRIELAYVDRPHLARQLVILRLSGRRLTEIARLEGLTAHRIGDTTITAALRPCNEVGAEILLPDADWQGLMAVTLGPDGASAGAVRGYGPQDIASALDAGCLPDRP